MSERKLNARARCSLASPPLIVIVFALEPLSFEHMPSENNEDNKCTYMIGLIL